MKKIVRKLFTFKPFESVLASLLKKFPTNFLLRGLAPSNTYYSSPSIRICNRHGINYQLDISDYQNWLLYFSCKSDSSFGVLNYIKKGDIILDMGGNIGQTALMMANFAGNESKVYSFEPYPETYDKFLNNIKLNPSLQENILVNNYALGDTPTILEMIRYCKTNSGSNRMLSTQFNKEESVEVQVSTIDVFVEENNISKLDFIKIDVEGFEMNVLKGANKTLLKFKPRLFIELNDKSLKEQGSSARELLSFLKGFGYVFFEDGSKVELVEDYFSKHIDIYCEYKLL